MTRRKRPLELSLLAILFVSEAMAFAQDAAPPPEIPIVPGLTFVLAVHNPHAAPAGSNIATSDFEMAVGVSDESRGRVTSKTTIDAQDERKRPLQLDIERRPPRR